MDSENNQENVPEDISLICKGNSSLANNGEGKETQDWNDI